jgi:hypothetical protein
MREAVSIFGRSLGEPERVSRVHYLPILYWHESCSDVYSPFGGGLEQSRWSSGNEPSSTLIWTFLHFARFRRRLEPTYSKEVAFSSGLHMQKKLSINERNCVELLPTILRQD